MRRFKWYWIVIALLFVIVIVSAIAIPKLRKKTQPQTEQTDRPFPSTVQSQYRSLPNEEKYDARHTVIPLADNTYGSIWSSLVYIRGDIKVWGENSVTVNTNGEQLTVLIPEEIRLYCQAAVVEGRNINKNDWIIFDEDSRYEGEKTSLSQLKIMFPISENIIIVSDVSENNTIVAFLIVKIGC